MSAETRAWKASHDMLLGLHLVGHGNGTEVFKQRSDMMRSEGLLWHRQGEESWKAAQFEGHCNCLSDRSGGHGGQARVERL